MLEKSSRQRPCRASHVPLLSHSGAVDDEIARDCEHLRGRHPKNDQHAEHPATAGDIRHRDVGRASGTYREAFARYRRQLGHGHKPQGTSIKQYASEPSG
jgi:hypothetical protein